MNGSLSSRFVGMERIIKLLLRYKNNIKIERIQREILTKIYNRNVVRRVIVFLVPGYDIVNGGIMSIASLCSETKKLKHIHSSEVFLCTIPGDPLLLRYTKFKNDHFVFSLPLLLSYFNKLEKIMIHIPEYAVTRFKEYWKREIERREPKFELHFNILLQNIKLLSSFEDIKALGRFGHVTCTTAHKQYTNSEIREKLGVPLHRFSVYISPEQYERRNFSEKKDIMVVSPDKSKYKKRILSSIKNGFSNLRIVIVKNIPYEKYKNLIAESKWVLTFGEGLDGYFVEGVFSGCIPFAVYNTDFFTPDFEDLPTIYPSYSIMVEKITKDLSILNNEKSFTAYNDILFNLCSKYYNYQEYLKNIERFYRGEYDFK
ncbi:MAG: hypothetical protein QW738_08975 [Nitrososphaeria archaeon]